LLVVISKNFTDNSEIISTCPVLYYTTYAFPVI